MSPSARAGLRLLPNAVTVAALCAGLTAIRLAWTGNYSAAAALIVLAAVLDGLDGKIARLLGSESAVGAELDSLCDLVNFGVAPALTLYFWGLLPLQLLGWVSALVYAVACLLRLARFNVGLAGAGPATAGFTGVPSPAGAMLLMLPLFAALQIPEMPLPPPVLLAFYMIAVAALMIGRLPTPALKLDRASPRGVLLAATAGATVLAWPWLALTGIDLAYLAMLAVFWLRRKPATETGGI